eukprot:8865677-Alexandrium_andersonii.AAC.1
MSASLVGSEMCIRDSRCTALHPSALFCAGGAAAPPGSGELWGRGSPLSVSYTHLTLPTICSV